MFRVGNGRVVKRSILLKRLYRALLKCVSREKKNRMYDTKRPLWMREASYYFSREEPSRVQMPNAVSEANVLCFPPVECLN